MARYDDSYDNGQVARTRDIILSTNEFCLIQSKTDAIIRTHVGPLTTTIAQQDRLVTFNPKTKTFNETADFERAKQLFVSAPEGWYVILKNPVPDLEFPKAGKENVTPPGISIGKKINISGPTSFALFPGQMAKTVRGHKLRSNQYLIARVYDAEAAVKSMDAATIVNVDGEEVTSETKENKYFVGQLLVIKGTEVSFYIPPTGIEVIPQTPSGDDYVREAITLERLEYAILKDEDGEKRYIHGPSVVFPKPTETFTCAPSGKPIFRALELSPISGIYIKVIAEYEENGVVHPVGEELFITGKDQMIYHPRPEHAMIQYDGKYMHHAIAIPEGEGRYILNRLTGEINTVMGPQMYLADPRTEVVVKRKLSLKECQLFYPGNTSVIEFNDALNEKQMEKMARKGLASSSIDAVYATANQADALAIFEANANISRGVSYTKPRTITLDTKYDGVVGIAVWTGYAINVVSKTGGREVVVGPTTRLLNYDETLEALELSTGKPKTTDALLKTAYLRVKNNKISDFITVQTKDYVDVKIGVSYCVDFLEEYKDKWFSVENYVKFLCDRQRSKLKRAAKNYTIQEFYSNSTDIIRETVLTEAGKYVFEENGMCINDVEVLSIGVERAIANILENHQVEMIENALELNDAAAKLSIAEALAEVEAKECQLKHENELKSIELEKVREIEREAAKAEKSLNRMEMENKLAEIARAEIAARTQGEADLQELLDAVTQAKIGRENAERQAKIEFQKAQAEIEKAKQEAYAETVQKIMGSISEDLVAAMTSRANEDMLAAVTQSMSPYAIANGESVTEVTNKLLRGTSLEDVLTQVTKVVK